MAARQKTLALFASELVPATATPGNARITRRPRRVIQKMMNHSTICRTPLAIPHKAQLASDALCRRHRAHLRRRTNIFSSEGGLERIDLSRLFRLACSRRTRRITAVIVCILRRILANSRNALMITAGLPPVGLPCCRGKWLTGTSLTVMPNLDT